MDKILELLKSIGATDELADQIVSEMKSWKKTEQNKLFEEYRGRLEKAKEVCVEETEGYKRECARKVEIFLESKVVSVERGARERLAIEESESTNKLKHVKAMLEGVQLGGTAEDLQATNAENDKLRRQLVTTTEERDGIKSKYDNIHGIAQKMLKRNQHLESKSTPKAPVTESRDRSRGKSKGTKLPRKSRGKTNTTRATLKESQVRGKSNVSANGSDEISKIAAGLSEIV